MIQLIFMCDLFIKIIIMALLKSSILRVLVTILLLHVHLLYIN